MIKPAKPSHEARRLANLHRYQILDTPAEQGYEDLVTILAGICAVPIGAVSLIDEDRQWFKASVGLDMHETARDISFCGHTILNPQELLVVEDATKDPRFANNPLVTAENGLRFYAGAPLVTPEGEALGALCVLDRTPRQLTPFQKAALRSLSRQATMMMELHRLARELRHQMDERDWYEQQLHEYQVGLETQNAQLTVQSQSDPLTGLANRRAFFAHLEQSLGEDEPSAVSLLMLDIDHFKRINDTQGHPAGDQVLMSLAAMLRDRLNAQVPSALAARVGGEEFAVLLPGMTQGQARLVAEEIRDAAPRLLTAPPVTVSIGVAQATAGESSDAFYARADAALYAAKSGGRDRVECL